MGGDADHPRARSQTPDRRGIGCVSESNSLWDDWSCYATPTAIAHGGRRDPSSDRGIRPRIILAASPI